MAASIFLNQLRSRVTRHSLTQGLNLSIIGGSRERDEQGNTLGRIVNVVGQVLGGGWNLLVSAVKGIAWSFTGLYNLFLSSVRFIATFNWNIPVKQIDDNLKALNKRIWGQLGESIGVTLGYTICGLLPSAGILTFNQQLGLFLLYRVGEEALDEISGELMTLAKTAWQNELTKWGYSLFKSTRKAIKTYYSNPNSPQSLFMKQLFGPRFDQAIKYWGEEGSEPFIISEQIDEWIDNIEGEKTRIIVEEAYEAFIESCVDAGYVVASGLDEWVMQQRTQNAIAEANNPEQVVEYIPDRSRPEESFILVAEEDQLRENLPIIHAQYSQVEARNLGTIIADPFVQTYSRSPYQLGISCRFKLTSTKGFLFRDSKRSVITIHDVERSKLDFERIIRVLGGENGFMSGPYFCKATLANGKHIVVNHQTANGGLALLKEIATLTPYEILNYNNPTKPSVEFAGNRPELPVRVYPYQVTITYKSARLIERYKKKLDDDAQIFKEIKLPLWGKKPDDWKEQINSLFTIQNPQPTN